jgi:predicted DNA-binding transcriptional regulator AlpA
MPDIAKTQQPEFIPLMTPKAHPEVMSVQSILGVGRTKVYMLSRSEGFPKALHLGAHSVRYSLAAVREWIEKRYSASEEEAA